MSQVLQLSKHIASERCTVRLHSSTSLPVLLENTVRREVGLAALETAQNVADAVLGAQMIDVRLLLFEQLIAQLTRKLQTHAHTHVKIVQIAPSFNWRRAGGR